MNNNIKNALIKAKIKKYKNVWVKDSGTYFAPKYNVGETIEELFNWDTENNYAIEELQNNILTGNKKMGAATKENCSENAPIYYCNTWRFVLIFKLAGLLN